MDDLEQKIGEILNDPAQLAGIMELAKSFGLAPPEDAGSAQQAASAQQAQQAQEAELPQPSQAPNPSQQQPAANLPPVAEAAHFGGSALPLGALMQAAKTDSRQENLLRALRPFLKPEKREKIDRAMQIAQLTRLAQIALKKPGKER